MYLNSLSYLVPHHAEKKVVLWTTQLMLMPVKIFGLSRPDKIHGIPTDLMEWPHTCSREAMKSKTFCKCCIFSACGR
jgi:hypothetical protein